MARTRSDPSRTESAHDPPDSYSEYEINVVSAIGAGETSLSAFDDALWRCGTQDYNHLALSSVIPPRSKVRLANRYLAPVGEFGHRLFVVMADARSESPGDVLAAAVAWLQWEDGRGVFVEHESVSRGVSCEAAETAIAAQCQASLRDLAARRGVAFAPERTGSQIVVTQVGRRPACALVLAIYESEGWK